MVMRLTDSDLLAFLTCALYLHFDFPLLCIFTAVVAVARAEIIGAPLGYAVPVVAKVAAPLAYAAPAVARVAAPVAVDTDYDPNLQYSYAYDIQDALAGDSKGQQ
jgi:hypothetical protein